MPYTVALEGFLSGKHDQLARKWMKLMEANEYPIKPRHYYPLFAIYNELNDSKCKYGKVFFLQFSYNNVVFPAAAETFSELVQNSSFSIDEDDRDIYIDCILKALLHNELDFTQQFIDLFVSKDVKLNNIYTFYLIHLIKYHGLKSGARFGK